MQEYRKIEDLSDNEYENYGANTIRSCMVG